MQATCNNMIAAERMLILAPIGRDARLVKSVLHNAAISSHICADESELLKELEKECGALLIAEEALSPRLLKSLTKALGRQPAWSDCPVLVITLNSQRSNANTMRLRAIEVLGNASFLERPLKIRTIVSVARSAIAARRRQYEVRDLLLHEQTTSRLKDEFLATLSHELRTPLSVILGYSEILRNEPPNSPDFSEAIDAICRNSEAQASLISDLLDISRITTRKIKLEKTQLNLSTVIGSAVSSLQFAASEKNIKINRRIDDDQLFVIGDPVRIQQIVWNLLSNAIKFSNESSEIDVILTRVDGHAKLIITDYGAGIKKDFLPFVFDRFKQQDSGTTRKFGGMGLGLAIVKHLVDLHGGQVNVYSDGPDSGASFEVIFPALIRSRTLAPSDTKASKHGKFSVFKNDGHKVTILVVDDQRDNRRLLRVFLERMSIQILEAESAAEARTVLQTEQVDAMICDISMPGESGLEFIVKLREDSDAHIASLPVAAFSAHAAKTDRDRALEAGFDFYLTKPIHFKELTEAIQVLVGNMAQV